MAGFSEFRTDVDIANRALQHCGSPRLDPTLGFSENSKAASETEFCYGKLRQAELRRNVWTFATRRAVLRAIDTGTMLLEPALWVESTTYFVGSIVADQNGNNWISRIPDNLGNQPLTSTAWEPYFGPLTVSLYATSTSYFAGEIVYTAAGDGTYKVFLSLQNGNQDNPATATAYDATATYFKNQVVTSSSVAYMSLIDLNTGNTPASSPTVWTSSFVGGTGSDKWLQIGGAAFPAGVGLTTLNITYPIGAGPFWQSDTKNVFRLPSGYLRKAPQNPKSGLVTWLGGPSGSTYSDWLIENDYIVTTDGGPITLRFVADVTDVTRMDPMFCEGLAARVALEVCEPITQSNTQIGVVAKVYDKWIGDARTVNAIENEFDDPPDDDYLTVRN